MDDLFDTIQGALDKVEEAEEIAETYPSRLRVELMLARKALERAREDS